MPRSVQKRRLAADKAAQIHKSRADEMHSLLVAWHKADEDNSGTLDLSEFTELVAHSQFCQDVTTEEVKALYERVDTDGDGQIDRRELEAWERNEREREKMKREETMLNTEQQLADWEEEQRQLDMAQNGNGVHYDMEQPEPEPEENTTQV